MRLRNVVEWNLFWWDWIPWLLADLGKDLTRGTYFEVSKLGELLPAVVQEAGEGFGMLMSDLMSTDIAPLGKPLLADIAGKGFLACMAPLMGLCRLNKHVNRLQIQGGQGMITYL